MRSPTRTDPRRWVRAIRITGFLIGTMLLGTLVTLFNIEPTPTINGEDLFTYLETADRQKVARDLAKISPDPIHHLEAAARSYNSFWSEQYKRVWRNFPRNIRDRLPYAHRSQFIQGTALQALGAYGRDAQQALPTVLRVAVEGPHLNGDSARRAALYIAPKAPEVRTVFERLLQDPTTRDSASAAIFTTHQYPDGIEDSLLPLDWSNPSNPPYNGLLAISIIGPAAASELPMIINALDHPDTWKAAEGNLLASLINMGPAGVSAIPTLRKRLVPDYGKRRQIRAIRALANMGPAASIVVPELEQLMTVQDTNVKCAAVYAIARISTLTEVGVNCLIDVIKSPKRPGAPWSDDLAVQYGFSSIGFNTTQMPIWVLGELAPHPLIEPALPHVRMKLSEGGRPWLTPLLARVIWRQQGETQTTLPKLIELLGDDKDPHVTLSAASVLGEMGVAAKTAIPALKAARQNDLFTRKAALEALRAIETAQ